MDSCSGQGSESLECFFDQVEEYTAFYGWDGQGARAYLQSTALLYVKRVRSADRREIQSSSSHTPSRDSPRRRSASRTDVPIAERGPRSAATARATDISPRNVLLNGSTE